jgi:hypothetical protein
VCGAKWLPIVRNLKFHGIPPKYISTYVGSTGVYNVSTFLVRFFMATIIFTFDEEVECPECAGFGEVEYEFEVIDHIRGGEIVGIVKECRMCEGSGVIYVEGEVDEDGD